MTTQSLKSPARQPRSASVNPFAAALAETEKHSVRDPQPLNTNPFSDALSRTGGSLPPFDQQRMLEQQQTEAREQQRKEMLRKRLHDQINPVETIDVFSARERKVKEEIEKLREELKLLIAEVKVFAREIDLETQKAVVDPGMQGKYHLNFFQQLRLFIMLLRKRIRSAGTWATQLNGKKKKRRSKTGPGLEMAGAGHEKTSTVHDMMHNERSSMYSGG